MFVGITLLFLDFTGTLHAWLSWMAKIQFLPAVMALNVVVVAVLVVLTLVFGRIYCSVICPLGVLQDLLARLNRKRNKYSYSKELRWLRYAVLGYDPDTVASMLENVVYLELRRRGYAVNVGKNGAGEVDFVATRQNNTLYVQVAQEISEASTQKREFDRLLEIRDNYPKYVLRTDAFADGNHRGIIVMHVADFLLSEGF